MRRHAVLRAIALSSFLLTIVFAAAGCTSVEPRPTGTASKPIALVDAPIELVQLLPLKLQGKVIASGTSDDAKFAIATDGKKCALAVSHGRRVFEMTVRAPTQESDLVSPPAWPGASAQIGPATSVAGKGATLSCGRLGAIVVFSPALRPFTTLGEIREHAGLGGSLGYVALPQT